MDFSAIVDAFPWESKEQREGYLAWVQYERKFGREQDGPIDTSLAFLIQKNHEAAEYWRETFSGQVDQLRMELAETIKEINHLRELYENQQLTLKALVR